MSILIFIRNGAKVPKITIRDNFDIRFISFDSNILEDLLCIARYKVVNFPTSLIINDGGKVLLKMRGFVPRIYINKFFNTQGS